MLLFKEVQVGKSYLLKGTHGTADHIVKVYDKDDKFVYSVVTSDGCWKGGRETLSRSSVENHLHEYSDPDDQKILSSEIRYIEKYFLMGQNADFEDTNPFEPETNKWFNWNRGKNTNNN